MQNGYQKLCIEENDCYRIYYGAGMVCSEEQSTNMHYDSDITITYFKQCRADIKIEDKHYAVKSGDIVIMNPNEIHCCTVENNSFHERISLFVSRAIADCFPFSYEELFDCFYNRRSGGNLIPAVLSDNCSIHRTMEVILSLSKTKIEKDRVLCICKIVELLSQLNDAAAHRLSVSAEHPTIARVIEYIGANFTKAITCENIAESFFISKFRLEHLFKECVGTSLWDYVILRRLLFVNELLQTEKTVNEAALKAGFHNYSNFYRLYKKHMGITPLEYKQRKSGSIINDLKNK